MKQVSFPNDGGMHRMVLRSKYATYGGGTWMVLFSKYTWYMEVEHRWHYEASMLPMVVECGWYAQMV